MKRVFTECPIEMIYCREFSLLNREIRSRLRILYLWFYLCFYYLINALTGTIFTIEKLYYRETMNCKQGLDVYLKRKIAAFRASRSPNLFSTINSNC